ncbi:Flp pilus assembly protein CpaB [Halomonas dongshanensis]|uniref:Flp pilus assembly protein CpaB n=1 Tax=Halomonas dongshanensis TaxID=2890835 RepID=A0ABT2EI60_9GAMM|nr:Flp pilus assembly protein CpaB [Halomonas dongshanensis]MCS2610790.1 Flp pilus assembly protein CpaB [Halomonas dongshanensis]
MNSRMMMVLAMLLVVAAVVVGYLGVSMGREAPAPMTTSVEAPSVGEPEAVSEPEPVAQTPDDVDRVPVVVLARSVPAYHVLQPEDLQSEQLRLQPPGSYTDPAPLIGQRIWRDIPQGTVLNESHFESGGPLARMIRPGERALALQYDQVLGAGGHLAPGDYVDVLLFLDQDELNTDRTVQVAVPALRVLSVGDTLGLTTTGEFAAPRAPEGSPPPNSARPETVVLAIPEALLTRFALAAEVGRLRLAVRAAEEGRLNDYYQHEAGATDELNQQLFQFEIFALSQAERPQPGLVAQSARVQPAVASSGGQAAAPPTVPVIRGAVTSLETP